MTGRGPLVASWGRTAFALGFLALLAITLLFPAVVQPKTDVKGDETLAWEAVNRLAYNAGQSPIWDPYSFSGYPGMANIQTLVYYPPTMLLRGLPLSASVTWGFILHIWIMGAGVFALCRQLGTRRMAGVVAAAGVMLSSAVAPKLYLGHIVVLYGYAWLPLALALAIRSSRRATLWPHPALVAVLVLQVLAGFVQGTVYVGIAVAAVFLWRALCAPATERRLWTSLLQPVVVFAFVGALAAFQLLPTFHLLVDAGRATGLDYATASEDAFVPGDFVTAVFPHAREIRSELLDRSVFITLGLLAFVPLAWIRAKRRCHAGFQLLMAVVALGLAMAHTLPLYRLHYALLPQLRVPTRFMLFWYIGMAVLGGLGLDALLRRAGNRRALPGVWQAWAPAATAGLLLVLALATSSWTGGTAGVLGTPGWLVAIQLGALLTLGALVARRQAGLAGAVALLLVTTEGLVFAAPFVRVEAGSARDPAVEQLATHDMVRVTSLCEQRLRVHDLVSAGIPTPDGFGSISLARYARFLRLVRDNEIEGYANVNRLGQNIERLPARLDLLDYLAVTHVVTCEPIDHERFRLVEPLGSMFLYRNLTVRPRALLTCAGEPHEAEEVMQMLARGAYDREGRLIGPPPKILVRWAPETSDYDRLAVERSFGLAAGNSDGDRTWEYDLLDTSQANVRALLNESLVEDTSGIDRGSGRVVPRDPEPALAPADMDEPSLVLDTTPCGGVRGAVTVHEADRADGRMRLTVENAEPALLYLSEPFHPERRAWVDGEARPVERVNVAFSGVRLDPGAHVVELRFVPRSLHWGLAISVLTALLWIGSGRWAASRRHRPSSAS